MTSTTTVSIGEQVRQAAGRLGRQYPQHVSGVVDAIVRTGTVQAGKDYLSDIGYGSYGYLLDSVNIEDSVVDVTNAPEIIRAFISSSDTRHNGTIGYSDEEVTALLVLAGLEDEPEPEPEVVEVEAVDAGLFRRLVEFARGHGFRG